MDVIGLYEHLCLTHSLTPWHRFISWVSWVLDATYQGADPLIPPGLHISRSYSPHTSWSPYIKELLPSYLLVSIYQGAVPAIPPGLHVSSYQVFKHSGKRSPRPSKYFSLKYVIFHFSHNIFFNNPTFAAISGPGSRMSLKTRQIGHRLQYFPW